MVPPTNTHDTEPEPEIEWGPPTAWLPDPRTGRTREYTHAEVLAALLAGDPEEERREREEAERLERVETARKEREEAQRRERESAEREAREQEKRSSSGTRRKRGHTHAEMLAALLGDSEQEAREPKQEQPKGRYPAQRGDRTAAEPRACERGQQANAPSGAKKRRERTHADMLAALLGDPDKEQRAREQADRREREQAQRREQDERRVREQAQEGQDHATDTDDECGPISFAGGPMLEGMGLPSLDEAMQKLRLRAKRQEEKDVAKKKREEEEAARAKQKDTAAKQEAEAAKQEMTAGKAEGTAKEKASSVIYSRDHEDMGEGRRMPDCRCARCDPCDCEDCHHAHYPKYRRKAPGRW